MAIAKPAIKHDDLATARRVLSVEIDGLKALSAALDDRFEKAVETIEQMKSTGTGRLIVAGIGKSGHVSRKMAATFASTGTPAQFVHPGEASHGDLGMVTAGDVAMVLSNSGETPELADIIAHTRRFDIPLIGVAGRAGSTLLRQSDVALLLPPAPEACDTGIVPTTSTTMTLALGDALAIALMEHRQFTPEHFRVFHPGGKLGAKLATVRHLMHQDLPLVPAETPMTEALLVMSQKGFGVVGVTDAAGGLAGIVTDGDLRRHMAGLLSLTAAQVMTANPRTIGPEALATKAVAIMQEKKITSLFVVDPEGSARAVGLIHIHDCLRAGVV